MLTRRTVTKMSLAVLVAAVSGIALALILVQRPGNTGTSNYMASSKYPPGTIIQSMSSSVYTAPEEGEIEAAEVVARGTVSAVSTSCWNTSDCTFRAPEEEWSLLQDELLSQFEPRKYYSVTFDVSEFWYNLLGSTSPLTITLIGASPVDPAPTALPTGEPGYVVEDEMVQENWAVGTEMVLLLHMSELKIDDSSVPILYAPYGSQYYVHEDNSLTNNMSDEMPRSKDIDELYNKVDAIKN